MFDEQIERIKVKLDVMDWMDSDGMVFSGDYIHYKLNPPASESHLQEFEAKHNLSLPEGYRRFLLQVGNGGAGPYPGLITGYAK